MNPTPPTIETPYTVAEVCALIGYSRRTVVRLFQNEHGVIAINHPTTNRKRRYCSIRIPRFVYRRVLKKLSR